MQETFLNPLSRDGGAITGNYLEKWLMGCCTIVPFVKTSTNAPSNVCSGGHWGSLYTVTPQKKKIPEHRITARKVDETPSPQYTFLILRF